MISKGRFVAWRHPLLIRAVFQGCNISDREGQMIPIFEGPQRSVGLPERDRWWFLPQKRRVSRGLQACAKPFVALRRVCAQRLIQTST